MAKSIRKKIRFITLLIIIIAIPVTAWLANQVTKFFSKASLTLGNQPVTRKVLVLNFEPAIDNEGGKKLTDLYGWAGWTSPHTLMPQIISDMKEASGGYLTFEIVKTLDLDVYPTKLDGFQYNDQTYVACVGNSNYCHRPDDVNYLKIVKDYKLCELRNQGLIDEVWMWGAPWFGYKESILAGPNGFWYNSSPLTGTTCNKQLPIMGFNYERGVSEALESFGHRMEAAVTHAFGSWEKKPTHAWNRFTMYDLDFPGEANCGNVHTPHNGVQGYDWTNRTVKPTYCEDWLNYPNLAGQVQEFNCEKWGCTGYGFKKYWFAHIPRAPGVAEGKLANWWKYFIDYEKALEEEKKLTSDGGGSVSEECKVLWSDVVKPYVDGNYNAVSLTTFKNIALNNLAEMQKYAEITSTTFDGIPWSKVSGQNVGKVATDYYSCTCGDLSTKISEEKIQSLGVIQSCPN